MTKYELKQRMTKDGRKTDNIDLFLDYKENPGAYYVTTAIATFHSMDLANEVLEFLNIGPKANCKRCGYPYSSHHNIIDGIFQCAT